MNDWKVIFSETAKEELRGIYEYIAFSLQAPDAAAAQYRKIVDMAKGLNQFPERHPLYHDSKRNNGLRVIPVNNYLIMYRVFDDTRSVVISRILYGGRNTKDVTQ